MEILTHVTRPATITTRRDNDIFSRIYGLYKLFVFWRLRSNMRYARHVLLLFFPGPFRHRVWLRE